MKTRWVKLTGGWVALAAIHYGLMFACCLLMFNSLSAAPFHAAWVLMFPARLIGVGFTRWIFVANSFLWAGALLGVYYLFVPRWRKRVLGAFVLLVVSVSIFLGLCFSATTFGWPAHDGRKDVAELLGEEKAATRENYYHGDGFPGRDCYFRFCGPPELATRLVAKYGLVELPANDQQFYQFNQSSLYWWNPGKQAGLVHYGHAPSAGQQYGQIVLAAYDKKAGRYYVRLIE
jgi:hypothetical protein